MSKNATRNGQDWRGSLEAMKPMFPAPPAQSAADDEQAADTQAAPAASVKAAPAAETPAPAAEVETKATEEPKPAEASAASPAPAQEAAPATPVQAAAVPEQAAPAASSETARANAPASAELLDLASIVIPTEVSPEERARLRQWSQGAASKLFEIRREIGEVRAKLKAATAEEDFIALEELNRTLSELESSERAITGSGTEGIRKSREFSELVEEIRNALPDDDASVSKVVEKGVTAKRIKQATVAEVKEFNASKKWPAGIDWAFRYRGDVYLSTVLVQTEGGEWRPTDAQKLYIGLLRELVKKNKDARRSEVEEKVSSITGRQYDDPHFYLVDKDGKPGKYLFHAPAEKKDGRFYGESYVIVETVRIGTLKNGRPKLEDRILEAIGGLSNMADAKHGRTRIPHFWVAEGRIISGRDKETGQQIRLEESDFRRSLFLIKTLRSLYFHSEKERRTAATATEQPVAPTTCSISASAAVLVETIFTDGAPETPAAQPQEQPATTADQAASVPKSEKGKGRRRKR